MKRRLFTLAIFLLLGAVVNVAVAWGCATWGKSSATTGIIVGSVRGAPESDQQWYITNDPWPTTALERGVLEETRPNLVGVGWHQRRFWEPARIDSPPVRMPHRIWPGPQRGSAFQTRAGWPLLCLYGEQWNRYIKGGERTEHLYRGASTLPQRLGLVDRYSARILPLRPISTAFAINTLCYAAILWLAIPGPFVLRRHIRRKRGLCVACGYDIRHADHNACPECGAASGRSTEADG